MKSYVFSMAVVGCLFTLVHNVSGDPFVLSDVILNNNGAYFVAVGDVNGDGKPDLVTTDANSTFTVLTNAGHGIFVSNATYNVGNAAEPYAVAIADVNGDGKLDVITANEVSNTVTIFTNAGGGVLVSNASYAVGNDPAYLLVTDINGDGKPDIITANAADGTLTILTNAGGTFHLADTPLAVSSTARPSTLAIADLNGDGKPDLIVGFLSSTGVEALTNAGGGIFVSNAVYPLGIGVTRSVVAADFNDDGKMDIASGHANSTVIFTNAGNGTLVQSQSIPQGAALIMAADVDGDGYTDLLLGEQQSDGVNLLATLYNSGSGAILITNYLDSTNMVNTTIPNFFGFAVMADVNGDGKLDVIGLASPYVYVLTNGIGSFPNTLSINTYSNINFAPVTNITVAATSASGAVANFTTIASNWTGSWPVTNTPPSGSVFPIGTTTVTVSSGYFVKSNIFGSAATNFTVTVVDTNPPVITLVGANPLTNFVGGYSDPGATATDPFYGNLTSSIVVSANVNANLPGTYTVTYSVTNAAGDSAMANRTVVLIPLPPLGVAATTGNQTALFWPPNSDTNYVLQMTTNLSAGDWVDVTNGRPLIGFFVTNTAPAAFFRLEPE